MEVNMLTHANTIGFQTINRGYNSVFRPNRLSLGLVVPIETYANSPVPTMVDQLDCIQFG